METGHRPLSGVFHPVHTRFARYWHRRYDGLGPVFANRPDNYQVRPSRLAEVVAYVHMNPVRAKVVKRPADSHWTSHRFYLRLDPFRPLGSMFRATWNVTTGPDEIRFRRHHRDPVIRLS